MKKPVEHKCTKCGNVYYYRRVKYGKRCRVCKGDLLAKGYRFAIHFGNGKFMIPDIPAPPKHICGVVIPQTNIRPNGPTPPKEQPTMVRQRIYGIID